MKKIQALFCLGCLAICTISFAQQQDKDPMEETRELKEVNYDIITTQQYDTAQKLIVTDSVALKVAESDKPVKKTAPNKPIGK